VKCQVIRKRRGFAASTPREAPQNRDRSGEREPLKRTLAPDSSTDAVVLPQHGQTCGTGKGKAARNNFFRPQVRQSQQVGGVLTGASSVPRIAAIPSSTGLRNLRSSAVLSARKAATNRGSLERPLRGSFAASQGPAGHGYSGRPADQAGGSVKRAKPMVEAESHYGADILSQGAIFRPKRTASAASRKN